MDETTVIIHTDGGSRGNPGPASAGFWLPATKIGGYRFLGTKTNNEAEYEGLILALEFAIDAGFLDVSIKADSKLVVNQVSGSWTVKSPHIQALLDRVNALVRRLDDFEIEYVPREENSDADRQCNECLDAYEGQINNDPTGFYM